MCKATRRPKPPSLQVIVTVTGGVADVLFKSPGVAVTLYDYDVQGSDKDDTRISKDPDNEPCCVREWEPSDSIVGNEQWPVVKKATQGVYSRVWKCPGCDRTVTVSYEDLAEAGSPICTDCEREMDML